MLFIKAEIFCGDVLVLTKTSEAQGFRLEAEGGLYQNLELFNLKIVIFDKIPSQKNVLKVLFSFQCGTKAFLEPLKFHDTEFLLSGKLQQKFSSCEVILNET